MNWLGGGPPSATRIEDNIKNFVMVFAAVETTLDGQPKQIVGYLSDLETGQTANGPHTTPGRTRGSAPT